MNPLAQCIAAALALLSTTWGGAAFAQTGSRAAGLAEATYGMPAGFHSRFATANGVRLHYVIGGSGAPVLLIHGWPENWYEWRKVMPILARNHTVIAVDMRGFGWSQIMPAGYDRKTLSEDLYRLVRGLGFEKVTVIGHDWGGPVAYAYAATHRDAVDRLVLADGVPDGPWRQGAKAPFLHNPYWFFGFFEVPDYAERVLAGHEAQFLDWFYRNKGFHVVPGGFSDADVAFYEAAYARPGRLGASLNLYRTLDQDIADNAELSKQPLAIPVLAIGAQRGMGPAVAEAASHVASDVTPVLMEDTGHFLAEERPAAFAEIIEAFLASQPVSPVWKPAAAASN